MSNGCVAYKAATDSVSFIPKVFHAVISLTFILTSLSDSHAASFQSCFLCCSDQIATSIYCGSVSHSVLTVMLSAAPEWAAWSQLISVQSTVMSVALVLPYLRQYDLFTPPVGYDLKHTHTHTRFYNNLSRFSLGEWMHIDLMANSLHQRTIRATHYFLCVSLSFSLSFTYSWALSKRSIVWMTHSCCFDWCCHS